MRLLYWQRAWLRGGWIRRLSGLTCEPSTLEAGVDSWMASLRASRASRSAKLGAAPGVTTHAGSGTTSLESLPKPIPSSSLARTSPAFFVRSSDSTGSSEALRTWVTRLRRYSSGLRTSERHIAESESSSSLWPTSTTTDAKSSRRVGLSPNANDGTTLTDAALHWATPVVMDGESGPNDPMPGRPEGGRNNLRTQAMGWTPASTEWPTPTASLTNDGETPETWMARKAEIASRETNAMRNGVPLTIAVKLSDIHGHQDRQTETVGAATSKPTRVLNPRFVEVLMGLVVGWSDSEPLETPSSHSKPHEPGASSGASTLFAKVGELMPVIDVPVNELLLDGSRRRRAEEVLGYPESGPSARGSTYWRRVLSCSREHLLANELGWTHERRPDALDFGLVWHFVLEALYRGLQARQHNQPHAEAPDVEAFRVIECYAKESGWETGYATISRMLNAYCERWWTRDQNEWQILDVECEVGVSLADGFGFAYTSRLDLAIIDHQTRRTPLGRLVEHKSSIDLRPDILTGYTQDLQVLGQVWLGERCIDWAHYGVPFMGSIVNITSKEKVPGNERMLVHPRREHMAAFEESMRYWETHRAAHDVAGAYPRNYANCTRKFGRCAFFDFCASQPDVTAAAARAHHARVRAGEAEMPSSLRAASIFDDE